VRDRYSGSKAELKKAIKALIDTPYEELDRWDDRKLRQWLYQHTSDQGVARYSFAALKDLRAELAR
jgi:hypothetical protein